MNDISVPEIDDLDVQLVKELEIDSRQSNLELASTLGISEATVRRRIRRLLESRAITIAAISDAQAMGFQTRVLVGIKTSPGESDNVSNTLNKLPNVRTIMQTTGRFDIVISAFFQNPQELLDFISNQLGNIPNLKTAEEMLILKIQKTSWRYLRGKTSATREAIPRHLDELELRMIRELEANPRESVINLSRKLGINRIVIGRKLQELLNEKIVGVVSIINPQAFGFAVQAIIFVTVHPGKVESVADILVRYERVAHLALVTGRYNIFLWGIFRNMQDLSEFIRKELGSIPGIVDHETMIQVALSKQSFELVSTMAPSSS